MLKSYGKFARANMMSAMVSALPLLRFAEKQGWLGHRVFRGSGVETGEVENAQSCVAACVFP